MNAPVLVGCSHGTDSVEGRAAIRSILRDIAAARPGLEVPEAFVDVQEPAVADVVAHVLAGRAATRGGAAAGGREAVPGGPHDVESPGAVVVPLLLSTGFHVRVDVAAAVEGRAARAAGPLGPDGRLVAILRDRLAQAGLRAGDALVLAAAGSTDPDAARDVREVAARLEGELGRAVVVGFGAGARPSVPEAVERARAGLAGGGRVVVAAYLLAPGFFYDRVLEAGADVVTAPLAPDVRLAEIALARFDEALARAEVPVRG